LELYIYFTLRILRFLFEKLYQEISQYIVLWIILLVFILEIVYLYIRFRWYITERLQVIMKKTLSPGILSIIETATVIIILLIFIIVLFKVINVLEIYFFA
jgi:hypothetical protein